MRHAASEALYAYWNEVRRGRLAPERLEIQPARLGHLLRDTFILERINERTFRFRLTGTRVSQRFGMDLRSIDFLDRWNASDHGMLKHHLASVTDRGCAAVLTAETQTLVADANARPANPLTFEILVLPLVHTRNAIDRLLCAIAPLDEPPPPPNARLASLKLVGAEPFWPDGYPHDGGDLFAERDYRHVPVLASHVRMARIVRRGRRQFRVYEGGRKDNVDASL